MEANTPEPTPIYWGTDTDTPEPKKLYTLPTEFGGFTYPKEWDGESNLIIGFDPNTGMAQVVAPADAKTYKESEPSYHDRFNAEDLDRKCNEVNR